MKVRLHLVIDQDPAVAGAEGGRIDLTATVEGGSPYGPNPVLGAIDHVRDLTLKTIAQASR